MCSWWSMDATATNGGADMTADDNRAAVTAADLTDHVVWRTAANRSALQHNKFLVLTNNDQPVAVWTGSPISPRRHFRASQCRPPHP